MSRHKGRVGMRVQIVYICSHYCFIGHSLIPPFLDTSIAFSFLPPSLFPLPFSLRALPLLKCHSKPVALPQQPHPLLQLRPPLPLLGDKRRGHSGTDHTVNNIQQSETGQWRRLGSQARLVAEWLYTVLSKTSSEIFQESAAPLFHCMG